MKTGVPSKGKVLTQISLFWFDMFKDICPNHIITADIDQMPEKVNTRYISFLLGITVYTYMTFAHV